MRVISSFILLFFFLFCDASNKNDLHVSIEETMDTSDESTTFLQEWIEEYDELYGTNLTPLQLALLLLVWENSRKTLKDKP